MTKFNLTDYIDHKSHQKSFWYGQGPLRRDLDLLYTGAILGFISDKKLLITGFDHVRKYFMLSTWPVTFWTLAGVAFIFTATVLYKRYFISGSAEITVFQSFFFLYLPPIFFLLLGFYYRHKAKKLLNNLTIQAHKHPLFDREDSTVTIPQKGDKTRTLKFNELQAYVITARSSLLQSYTYLNLVKFHPETHKKEIEIAVRLQQFYNSAEEAVRAYSFLCQYMDKTKPLPLNSEILVYYILGLGELKDRADFRTKLDLWTYEYIKRGQEEGLDMSIFTQRDFYYLDPKNPAFTGPKGYDYYEAEVERENLPKDISVDELLSEKRQRWEKVEGLEIT